MSFLYKNKGFSLIEVLVALAIFSFLSFGAISSLSSYRNSQVLSGETSQILSILQKARENTLSSKSQAKYSVRLNEDRVILYEGIVFSSSTPTSEEYVFHPSVHLSNISLNPAGLDISFARLTGEVSGSGSFFVSLRSGGLKEQKIVVKETGFIGQE